MAQASTKRVGFFQFAPRFGRVRENLREILAGLDNADADIIVLPELALTGYCFRGRKELESLAEEAKKSASVKELAMLCRRRRFHLVTGFAEKSGRRCYNSALLIGPEGLAGTYRKLHLFDTEKELFDPGRAEPRVWLAGGVKIGVMICFDWIFPETARVLALKGADLICHPANLVLPHCQEAMRTRCIENRLFAVTANRFGSENRGGKRLFFTGKSRITGPDGRIIRSAGRNSKRLCIAEIDPGEARNKHINPHNDIIDDRRPYFYRRLASGRKG